jgi:hypothetical protein
VNIKFNNEYLFKRRDEEIFCSYDSFRIRYYILCPEGNKTIVKDFDFQKRIIVFDFDESRKSLKQRSLFIEKHLIFEFYIFFSSACQARKIKFSHHLHHQFNYRSAKYHIQFLLEIFSQQRKDKNTPHILFDHFLIQNH